MTLVKNNELLYDTGVVIWWNLVPRLLPFFNIYPIFKHFLPFLKSNPGFECESWSKPLLCCIWTSARVSHNISRTATLSVNFSIVAEWSLVENVIFRKCNSWHSLFQNPILTSLRELTIGCKAVGFLVPRDISDLISVFHLTPLQTYRLLVVTKIWHGLPHLSMALTHKNFL